VKHFEETKRAPRATLSPESLLKALFEELKPVQSDRSQSISPSEMNCQVSQVWKVKGVKEDQSAESFQSRQFAEAGEDRHNRIQEFLSGTQYWVDVEKYVKEKNLVLEVVERQGHEVLLYSPTYNVRFRCDGMLNIDGVYYVLEIKTEGQTQNDKRTGAAPKHQKQGLSYALLLDVDNILWLYEGRAFFTQRPFLQAVTAKDKSYIAAYLQSIMDNLDTPENLFQDKPSCPYCGYKTYCKEYFKSLKARTKDEQNRDSGTDGSLEAGV
jgi:hypothetical protein